jgi:hypothetical protein
MKSQDYIPHSESEQAIWAVNFKTNLVTQGAALGLTAAQITALGNSATNIVTAINNGETKKRALSEALAQKETVKDNEFKVIRENVAKIKTNAGYTPAIGKSLGIIGTATSFDSENYKASITASIVAGCVRIKFVKNGADGINIYNRPKGTAVWKFLARDTKSPYDDHIELATAGQPEHWEYRAFGVIDDAEIGQPSDIVEIVFGG